MHIGIQLHAPLGFECLKRNVVYHFLKNDLGKNRIVLVTFGAAIDPMHPDRPGGAKATANPEFAYLGRASFEDAIQGLDDQKIVPCDTQRELPDWLGGMTSSELLAHEEFRTKGRESHAARIDRMLAHIWPAVQRSDEIFSSDDPVAVLNELARACVPKQNETRYRKAYLAYVAFGLNRWALHYSIRGIGAWERSDRETKFGRPSIQYGPLHGHSACNEIVQRKMIEGYRKYCGNGVHMTTIHRDTLTKVFGCKVKTDAWGIKRYFHPEGKAFPTYRQFEYWVAREVGLPERQVIKYGEARTRNRLQLSLGSFAQSVGNLMEIVEEDAYQVDEVSKGYEEGSLMPKLWVVRIRCLTSGLITGIGFSVGGERASAYRMAKACQASDKVWYCSLYGVEIGPEDWPGQGLSMHEITDRGAGATMGAQPILTECLPIIKEGAPSYAGQSKANIETTNPKPVKIEGAPHYRITRLTIPQLAIREIRRVIQDNHTINIGARLNNQAIAKAVLPTPIHLWNYLEGLGRTHAVRVPRDMAIRAFFNATELTIRDGSLYLLGQRYWSAALAESGVLSGRAGSPGNNLRAYMLDVCVRHLFVETPAGLLQVDAMHGIRDGDEMLYLSVVELEQIHSLRKRGISTHASHAQAAKAEQEQLFEEQTGLAFSQGTQRRGRAKLKNAASVEEARLVIGALRGQGGGQ